MLSIMGWLWGFRRLSVFFILFISLFLFDSYGFHGFLFLHFRV